MTSNHISLMSNHINKLSRVFKAVLIVLSLMELALMIRGFILFDLTRLKLKLYLFSYVFLFVTSVATLIIFCISEKSENRQKINVITVYAYAFCLIMWSAVVTTIDCYANGDSGIMVYVMTCIAVGVLALIRPWIFLCYMGVSGAFVIIMTALLRDMQLYSSGFYINFVIFLVTSAFVNDHNYRLSKREYEASKTLEKWSYTDQLTEVYNRRMLDQRLQVYISGQSDFVFILLDIDDFKKINDTYGHPEGDRCLVELAAMLTYRFGDNVYRFGGDEFALISSESLASCCKHIDEINEQLGTAFGDMALHISAGVYAATTSDSASAIFSNADKALYDAKAQSKARWVIYEEK